MKPLFPAVLLAAALAATLATGGVAAAEPVADEAVFIEGALYSAVLSASQRSWRLLPADGPELRLSVAPDCQGGQAPPRGLWLLTRDAQGQPGLVAPSSTELPAGHPGHVRLVDCRQPLTTEVPALPLPAGLLEWLDQHSGVIYVGH